MEPLDEEEPLEAELQLVTDSAVEAVTHRLGLVAGAGRGRAEPLGRLRMGPVPRLAENASFIAISLLLIEIVPVEAFFDCSSFTVASIFSSSACK